MEIQTEAITAAHLPGILAWWVARGQGGMPAGVLPPHGMVASDAHGPAVAAWVYFPEGCPLAILDWLVGRPGLTPATARAAGRAVFAAIEELSRARGCTRIFASVAPGGMAREARLAGFHICVDHAQHLTKDLS